MNTEHQRPCSFSSYRAYTLNQPTAYSVTVPLPRKKLKGTFIDGMTSCLKEYLQDGESFPPAKKLKPLQLMNKKIFTTNKCNKSYEPCSMEVDLDYPSWLLKCNASMRNSRSICNK